MLSLIKKRMSVRVRFAPSPTGALHIGGLRTALYNYLFAKKNKGKFILRIEDTDQNRKVDRAEGYITEALSWSGLEPDESPTKPGSFGPYRQSERKEIYKKYIEELIDKGRAYYAFDTPDELSKTRAEHELQKKTFMYGVDNRMGLRNALNLSSDTVEDLLNTVPYVVRLKVDAGKNIKVKDGIRGYIEVKSEEIDDKILMKADGMPTYHFANVVDDHLMEITDVIRGEEWLPSLALHQLIYDAFGWDAPNFMHLPLILKPQGKGKLSKRDGEKIGFPVFPLEWGGAKGFKERGFLPEALMNYLALLGWNPGTEEEIFEMGNLIEIFETDKIQKGGAKFDFEKAKWVNHKFLGFKEEKIIFERFPEFLSCLPSTWSQKKRSDVYGILRDRLFLLEELKSQSEVFLEDPVDYDAKVMNKIQKHEPKKIVAQFRKMAKDKIAISEWKSRVQVWNENEKLPFGAVMQSLRMAIVGNLSGPDIFTVCEILGNQVTLNRLEKFINNQNL
jgi:glutamyl-tRNA synthetase